MSSRYECCQDNRSLMWIDAREVLNDGVKCGPLWGPEVKLFTANLIKTETKFIAEFCLSKVLALINHSENRQPPNSGGQLAVSRLLVNNKTSQETLLALYEDFIEFCFPSFYMCFESFKQYFKRYNKNDAEQLFGLFRGVSNAINRKGYLDWSEFVMAAFCLDPTTENDEGRCLLLFHYYNRNGNNQMELSDFVKMLKDLNPSLSDERLTDEVVRPLMHLCNFKENKLSLEDFQQAIRKDVLRGTEKLLRAPMSIISPVVNEVKKRWQSTAPDSKKAVVAKRRNRGTCNGCRAQNFQYCLHAVTFDTTGRCVNPMRISKYEGKEEMRLRF